MYTTKEVLEAKKIIAKQDKINPRLRELKSKSKQDILSIFNSYYRINSISKSTSKADLINDIIEAEIGW